MPQIQPAAQRRRGARLVRRRNAKTPPTRPKQTICVTRLVVEDLRIQNQRFVVTVSNAGNQPSYQVRINVYVQPGHVYGQPEAAPVLAATAVTTLGVLERKEVVLEKLSGGIASLNPYFAVAFDPINDPFPTRQTANLGLQERNLLSPTLQPSMAEWTEYGATHLFGFDGAVPVPAGRRTWTLTPIADLGNQVPANATAAPVFFPHATPTAHSELRHRIDIDDAFFVNEIGRGNVEVHASCQLYTYEQTPRDRGALWLRLSNVVPAGESVLGAIEPPLTSPHAWTPIALNAAATPQLTSITVRLLAERRTGHNNNAYFADVRCFLKHRQVKLR